MIGSVVVIAVLRLGLRLELAPEYDSNANRVETSSDASASQPVGSFLLRSTARGRLSFASGAFGLRAGVDVGTKFFVSSDARPQDMAVVRGQLEGTRRLGEAGALHLAGDYVDSFQWNGCPNVGTQPDTSCHRDLRLASLRVGGTIFDRVPSLALEGSVRRYEWKPDPDLGFVGLAATGGPSVRLGFGADEHRHAFVLGLSGRLEWRRYDGGILEKESAHATIPGTHRGDLVATLGVSLAYTGPVLASAEWLVETDRSDSAGGSYLYQGLTLRLAVPLPGRITVTTRAQLLFFSAGHLPSALAADEENRDAVLVDVARDMGRGVSLAARYLVFRSATGDALHEYLRQVATLSLIWAGDR